MYCNTICTQAGFFSLLGVLDFLPNDYLNGTPYVAAEYYYIYNIANGSIKSSLPLIDCNQNYTLVE